MAAERVDIGKFLSLSTGIPILDVRSPAEYKHAHIPGAISFPLFSDEERKIVGTAYKQESRERAIKLGLDFFGGKMRPMVEDAEQICQRFHENTSSEAPSGAPKVVAVHCWRGGMRSSAIAWLLDLYGFKVYTLAGGYKKYRHYILDTFTQPIRLHVIGGYTGSGKTSLLQELKKQGSCIIDLEGLAKHKGSAFGNLDFLPQPGQEMFENLLGSAIREIKSRAPDPECWVEDESQRIGLVNLPNPFWQNLRQSPLYFLDIPFETRLANIVQEYGRADKEKLIAAIGRISDKLGHLNAKNAKNHIEMGDFEAGFGILLGYYDKLYLRSLHNREAVNSLLQTIPVESITLENVQLLLHSRSLYQGV